MLAKRRWTMAIFLALVAVLGTRGEEPGWRQSHSLAADEAHQAAAADERYVYAVASREIAKYERATGRKIAVSSGEAQHLNSAVSRQVHARLVRGAPLDVSGRGHRQTRAIQSFGRNLAGSRAVGHRARRPDVVRVATAD